MAESQVGKIYYTLDLDSANFKKGVDESSAKADSLGKTLEGVGKKAAIFFTAVAAGAVAFAVSSVKAYQDNQDSLAQMDAALKSTGHAAGLFKQDLLDQAQALQEHTRYSHEAVQGVENLLLTFTDIHGAVYQKAVPAILDVATAMHEDLQSASVQVGKALNDPVLGMTALHRIGVTFSDDQKKVIKQLVDTGDKAGAQQVILKELNKEFGGSAEAAGNTFAGSLDKLKNAFTDIKESIGQTIVKGLQPLATWLASLIGSITAAGGPLKYLSELYEKHKGVVTAIAGAVGGALVLAFYTLVPAVWAATWPILAVLAAGALLGGAVNWLVEKLGGWHKVWKDIEPAVKAVWSVLKELGQYVGSEFKTIFESAVKLWDQMYQSLKPVFEFIKEHKKVFEDIGLVLLAIVASPIIGFIGLLMGALKLLQVVLKFVADHFKLIKEIVEIVVAVVFGPLILIVLAVIKVIQNMGQWVKDVGHWFKEAGDIVSDVFHAIWSVVSAVIGAVWNFVSPVLNFLKDLFVIVFGSILIVVLVVLEAVWRGITTVFNFIWTIITTVVGWIWDRLVTAFDFWKNLFLTVFNAIADFVSKIWNSIYKTISGIVQSIINFFAPALSWLYEHGKNIVMGLVHGIEDVASAVWNGIKKVADQIGKFFVGAVTWLFNAGKDVVMGLVNGIESVVHKVTEAANKVAKAVTSTVKGLLGIKSPSTVFHDFGTNLVQGFVNGINSSAGLIDGAMNNTFGGLTPTLNMSGNLGMAGGAGNGQGTQINNSIGIIHINSDANGQDWLQKLTRQDQLISMGLSG